jgi:AraC-like DNA-binding protein/quercetin dioxygenase-like cupin family protein
MSRSGQRAPQAGREDDLAAKRDVADHVSLVELVRPLAGVAADYPDGDFVPRHSHDSAQLVYASTGVMSVHTDEGTWVVPPERAVWVQRFVVHSIGMSGDVHMRTVYVDTDRIEGLPSACCVVNVSPLLRALILRTVSFEQPYDESGPEARMAAVLVDELRSAPEAPLHLPALRDVRARKIAAALRENPGDPRSLKEWSREAGASERTLARLFREEAGMTFGSWRQQVRLLAALERLASGDSVTNVALDCGYESPSAFIAMFRRALGVTPGQYFASPREEGES